MLSAFVFIPLIGALVILVLLRSSLLIRSFALLTSLVHLLLAISIFVIFQQQHSGSTDPVMVEKLGWIKSAIPSFPAEYFLGLDGLSAPLVLLCGLLGFISVCASWRIEKRVKLYFVLILVLLTAVSGVFVALDLVLFFIFWELELIPMYLLIALWGTVRAHYSAMKFLIFTILGSAFMLIGILALYFSTGTFDMTILPEKISGADLILPASILFMLTIVGFAIKLPVFPFHTWLPDAMEGPTPVSALIHAATMVTAGVFLVVRCSPMYEYSELALSIITVVGMVTAFFAATVALVQSDIKKIIAYSTCSQLGYMFFAAGVGAYNVAMFHLFTHAFFKALLFLGSGSVIHSFKDEQDIRNMGGVWKKMPYTWILMIIGTLALTGSVSYTHLTLPTSYLV